MSCEITRLRNTQGPFTESSDSRTIRRQKGPILIGKPSRTRKIISSNPLRTYFRRLFTAAVLAAFLTNSLAADIRSNRAEDIRLFLATDHQLTDLVAWRSAAAELGKILYNNLEIPKTRNLWRETKVTLWLQLIDKAQSKIDDVRSHTTVRMKVPAPDGAGIAAGDSPKKIKDPVLREEYVKAIEANELNAKKVQEAATLQNEVNFWASRLMVTIHYGYTATDGDKKELLALINASVHSSAKKGLEDQIIGAWKQPSEDRESHLFF